MKSPKDMRIIQIDVTNACIHACSNCTRFCGNYKKPFFMDFETFQRAVDSLEGYQGTISMIGGEPTLHPEFERFARYLGSKFEWTDGAAEFLRPQKEFMKSIHDQELMHTCRCDAGGGERYTVVGPGLWSCMGENYAKHYELIQDTFKFQALNDHSRPMYHQPALITRKELGITDEEWPAIRDNCWIQNLWSASITPKGAFFCEVAGTLDMLFGGDGGWPIEPGWWKREPEDFGDQLKWCEMCGMACKTFTRNANEEIDDVSPVMEEKLKAIDCIGIRKGRHHVIDIQDGVISEESMVSHVRYKESTVMPYAESYETRYDKEASVLFPRGFILLCVADKERDIAWLRQKIKDDFGKYDDAYVICAFDKLVSKWQNAGMDPKKIYSLESDGFGCILNRIFRDAKNQFYYIYMPEEVSFTGEFLAEIKDAVWNPGTLCYTDSLKTLEGKLAAAEDCSDKACELAIWNRDAMFLKHLGYDGIKQIGSIAELAAQWTPEKRLELSNEMFRLCPETEAKAGETYALYGAGKDGHEQFCRITDAGGIICHVVDSDPQKWGQSFENMTIENPEILRDEKDKIQHIVIASTYYYREVKEAIKNLGYSEDRMAHV